MRRQLDQSAEPAANPDLIPQREAIKIMRVRNVKDRYAPAFEKSGLQPKMVNGHVRLYSRAEAIEARKRLDEIEARELADRQARLPGLGAAERQEARQGMLNVLSAACDKGSHAEASAPVPKPDPAAAPKADPIAIEVAGNHIQDGTAGIVDLAARAIANHPGIGSITIAFRGVTVAARRVCHGTL